MEHLQILMERSSASESDEGNTNWNGHALMASCPPSARPGPSLPWAPVSSMPNHNRIFKVEDDEDDVLTLEYAGKDGSLDLVGNPIQQNTWNIESNDLASLMYLSKDLNLNGEITPVNAWCMVRMHERFGELGAEEIREVARELVTKVRCYGFGAVLEEFEVRDALDNIFFRKPDSVLMMFTS